MRASERARGLIAIGVLIGLVAAIAFWAGSNVAVSTVVPQATGDVETYAVEMGSVGQSINLPITASWPSAGAVSADRTGVLTSILLARGAQVSSGTTVVTIDLLPVVVASGTVPMFRALKAGESGPDVRQLQELLIAEHDATGPSDGRFDTDTAAATKRWQQAIGAPTTGEVDPGSLIFVDGLPARMAVTALIGDHLGPDSELLQRLGNVPTFVATVSATQRSDLASGQSVTIQAPGGSTWNGTLGQFTAVEGSGFVAEIEDVDCDAACSLVPISGQTALTGSVVVVAEAHGVVVPTSAILRQASGAQAVLLDDGTPRVVTIVAQANGFAVVQGLSPGTRIRLPSPPGP